MSATSSVSLRLPRRDGGLEPYTLGSASPFEATGRPPRSRVCFAAAHVVCDPLADADPSGPATVDWDTTLAFRRHLWDHGFGVAEAMDTAQRGMGLDWAATCALISRSTAEAAACGGSIACGAGTDQLPAAGELTLGDIERAYLEQCAFVEDHGAQVILMASRALARVARDPDDYRSVYATVLGQLRRPAILHWLGEAFDPALAGYWGTPDLDAATDVVLSVIASERDHVDGIKVSLLDAGREVALRRGLPGGVRMYTGDDFNYPELIRGDEEGHSDALLGIFDAIAPAAAVALEALDAGDLESYDRVLEPTVALSRHIFAVPTYHYKTGIVFLAYVNGHQDHFRMVGGLEGSRSITHLAELFVLADRAQLLRDPEDAAGRFRPLLTLAGVR